MTRGEAKELLLHILMTYEPKDQYGDYDDTEPYERALTMAIEALSQPIVAKHFDIQSGYIYCSPEIGENIKLVVRCKDCRKTVIRSDGAIYCEVFDREEMPQYGYCNWGERKGGEGK